MQHPSDIANTTAIQCHLYNLVFNLPSSSSLFLFRTLIAAEAVRVLAEIALLAQSINQDMTLMTFDQFGPIITEFPVFGSR